MDYNLFSKPKSKSSRHDTITLFISSLLVHTELLPIVALGRAEKSAASVQTESAPIKPQFRPPTVLF